MRVRAFVAILISIMAIPTLSGAAPAPGQPQAIGIATNIDNMVSGVVAGKEQSIQVGATVYQLETVRTNSTSKAQLVFLDKTGLAIGPASEVNLDRFVYDPDRSTGDVVVNLGKGTFRFVTGTQDKRNYRINAGVATIGVRGTIFHCKNDDMQLICVVQEGEITITLPSGTILTVGAGFGATIFPDGTFTPPSQFTGATGDPFGVGWQQFAGDTNFTTGAGGGGPPGNQGQTIQVSVQASTPCDTPSCS